MPNSDPRERFVNAIHKVMANSYITLLSYYGFLFLAIWEGLLIMHT